MSDNKLTKVDSKEHNGSDHSNKETDNSNRLIRFLKGLEYEKINEVMKFITTIGAIIVSFLTLYLEVKRKKLASEISDYFNLPRHYFLVSSNKVLLNLYNLFVYGLVLCVFLIPLILIVVNKDKKIRESELKFYSSITSILYSLMITVWLSLTDIPKLKHFNLYTLVIMIGLFLLCKWILRNLIIKYVGVIDTNGNDSNNGTNKSIFIEFIKDFFDKENMFISLYTIIFMSIFFVVGDIFFGDKHPKDIKGYEYICDLDDCQENSSANKNKDDSNNTYDVRIIINTVDKGKYLTMKGCIYKNGDVEKLNIYNDSYRIEEFDDKEFRYKEFDEVKVDKDNGKSDSNVAK